MNDDVLAHLEALLRNLSADEKSKLDELLAPELAATWLPNPGPQTAAYDSAADILLYGGAAGGGKTDLLIGLALTQHQRSVIFRRHYVDLRGVEERNHRLARRLQRRRHGIAPSQLPHRVRRVGEARRRIFLAGQAARLHRFR
jgi:hypothetical protein